MRLPQRPDSRTNDRFTNVAAVRVAPRPAATARVMLALLAAFAFSVAVGQGTGGPLQVVHDPNLGHFLAGPTGMTLYYFRADGAGRSNCYNECTQAWPPLLAGQADTGGWAGPGTFGEVARDDGARQIAYNGRPLYYFMGDFRPGETGGQGVNSAWWVANLLPAVAWATSEPGSLLVGPTGMTLYTFDADGPGVSNCTGGCLASWPPLVGGFDPANGYLPVADAAVPGELTTLQRADGTVQLVLGGRPLYYWAGDGSPGDATGDGVGGAWHVLRKQP